MAGVSFAVSRVAFAFPPREAIEKEYRSLPARAAAHAPSPGVPVAST
jgi:hypothetical protein